MPKYLAIVAYRCTVAGSPTDSIDLQVQYFDCESPDEAQQSIEAAPLSRYENPDGEEVTWPLAAILAIDEFSPAGSGSEVVGAITNLSELAALLAEAPAA